MRSDSPLVNVVGFDHLVLKVADVERSLHWYTERLGLEGVRVDAWRAGDVLFPSVRIDATTIIDLLPQSDPEAAACESALDHLCLVVAPINFDQLVATGLFDVAFGPTDGLFGAQGFARSLYIRDPDGITIELRSYAN
jgi:catechol 2,3-dioxygenase-like lactoylglutathione lyase family enzyme